MKKIISTFVLMAVFSLVSFGAGLTIDLCLSDNSNIHIISHALKIGAEPAIAQLSTEASSILGISVVAPTPTPNLEAISQKLTVCQSTIKENTSLYNYFKEFHLDYSFDHRFTIAKMYGIANYTGTAEQNKHLLQHIIQENLQKCLDSN